MKLKSIEMDPQDVSLLSLIGIYNLNQKQSEEILKRNSCKQITKRIASLMYNPKKKDLKIYKELAHYFKSCGKAWRDEVKILDEKKRFKT